MTVSPLAALLAEHKKRKRTGYIPVALHAKQREFIALQCREALFGGAAGGGKALALDTPIATPTGWSTMCELQVGDTVFDERGAPCRVVITSDVMHDRPCFEVEFSDGAKIVADAEHRWFTNADDDLTGSVRTTLDILDTIDDMHRVSVRAPLSLPDRYIIAVRPVPSVPVRCIGVDSESHLFLAGRELIPTHNTESLLADPLQYVGVPRYSALILRRTFTSLNLPGSIMNRSKQWLGEADAKWSDLDKRWTFPSGATLQFGYCDNVNDLDRYKSSEFQYIGVDELTEWPEDWYTFLFSRLRKSGTLDVPLKMRAATNPDGIGQEWVRKRFGIPLDAIVEAPIRSTPQRVFYPARAEDNPALSLAEYDESLKNLGPAKYQQLRWGRWMRDTSGLVYVIPESAFIDEAPQCHFHVLGVDYGFSNETAFVVWGWRRGEPTMYTLASEKKAGLLAGDAAERVQELERAFGFVKMVGDQGGLGKAYIEEARQRFKLPIEAAQKNNKRGYQELINGDLGKGRIKIVRSMNAALIGEAETLPWNHDRSDEAKGFANHCCDAWLYSWRELGAFAEHAAPKRPTRGSEEEILAQLDEEDSRVQQAARVPWYLRDE